MLARAAATLMHAFSNTRVPVFALIMSGIWNCPQTRSFTKFHCLKGNKGTKNDYFQIFIEQSESASRDTCSHSTVLSVCSIQRCPPTPARCVLSAAWCRTAEDQRGPAVIKQITPDCVI